MSIGWVKPIQKVDFIGRQGGGPVYDPLALEWDDEEGNPLALEWDDEDGNPLALEWDR